MNRVMTMLKCVLLAATPALLGVSPARGQNVPDGFHVDTLVPGLSSPVAFDFLPGGRVLFAEQITARVRLVRAGFTLQSAPVLSVAGVGTGGERGLLGLAIDPAFPARPYVYLHYDVASPRHIRIARYTLTGDLDGTAGTNLVADPDSRFDLIDDIPDESDLHNGGTLRFGIDGALYASLGEDAEPCAAQSPGSLRGVILRLRTDALPPGPGAAFRAQVTVADSPHAASPDSNLRLVVAQGLRNPFRFQIDPLTGTLAIADVGANVIEEVNLLQPPSAIAIGSPWTSGSPALGANYGWPWREGTHVGPSAGTCGDEPGGLDPPAFEYDRSQPPAAASIISAGFYRQVPGGENNWFSSHDGDLFANDYFSGVLRRIRFTNGAWSIAPSIAGQPSVGRWGTGFQQVCDWRIAVDGSLWFCRQGVSFAPNTGSLGRIRGQGTTSVGPAPGSFARLVHTPAIGRAELRVAAAARVRVRILDLSGRLVRTLWDGAAPVAPEQGFAVTWYGDTDRGGPARPGMYVALVESAGRRTALRIPYLR